MPILSLPDWDAFLSLHPDAHLLQTGAWGELKADFGWSVARLVVGEVGAQVLFRRLPLGFSLAYLPKGPVGGAGSQPASLALEELGQALDELCHRRRAVFLKVEPDLWRDEPASGAAQGASHRPSGEPPAPPGFRLSMHSIQPPSTLLVDLSGDEERVLARMKQKTRYNIRLALKKGVVVRASPDLETFHRLMEITGGRDGFGVHSLAYYRRAYELFHSRGQCEIFMAEYEGEPLGGLMVFSRGRRAWYLYGASSNQHRERMPTYILQWEAMRWARAQGCTEYDLWGAPDADEQTLEAQFTQRADGLWGVYRFKRGFGGQLCRAVGPWDRVYQPALYRLYRWWAGRSGRE